MFSAPVTEIATASGGTCRRVLGCWRAKESRESSETVTGTHGRETANFSRGMLGAPAIDAWQTQEHMFDDFNAASEARL